MTLTHDENTSRPDSDGERPPIVTGLFPPRAPTRTRRLPPPAPRSRGAAPVPSASVAVHRGPTAPGPDAVPALGHRTPPGPVTAPVTLRGTAPAAPSRKPRLPRLPRRIRFVRLGGRAMVVVGGALLLVVCSAMALGLVTGSPDELGFGGADGGPPVPAVDGVDGLYPGGPAHRIPLTVRNGDDTSFEITAVRPDLAALPPGCPATAWHPAAPTELPTVAGHAEATLTLPISLADDAPQACQALAVRLPVHLDGVRHPEPAGAGPIDGPVGARGAGTRGGSPAPSATAPLARGTLDTEARLTTATLGTPGLTVGAEGSFVGVTPTRPTTGPEPAAYDVSVIGPDGARTVICPAPADRCADRTAPAAADRRYVVTARLGTSWSRESATVQAWTAPPVPMLGFAGGGSGASTGQGAGRALLLQAAAAAQPYEVTLFADDAGTPFRRETIPPGDHADSRVDRVVEVPDLAPGEHRIVAVARFHGWRAPSGAVRLTVAPDGATTPGTVEAPGGVTTDPAESTASRAPAPSTAATAPPDPISVTRHAPVIRMRRSTPPPPPREVAPEPAGPEAPQVDTPTEPPIVGDPPVTDPTPEPAGTDSPSASLG